jgi:hypothetical protein
VKKNPIPGSIILIDYVNKQLDNIIAIPMRKKRRPDGLYAVWYYDKYVKESRIPLEFFAQRIHNKLGVHDGHFKDILFYTPLYIAYKD